jgi:hypothetical protein
MANLHMSTLRTNHNSVIIQQLGYKEWLWLYQIKQHLTACKDTVIVGAEFGIVDGLKRRDFCFKSSSSDSSLYSAQTLQASKLVLPVRRNLFSNMSSSESSGGSSGSVSPVKSTPPTSPSAASSASSGSVVSFSQLDQFPSVPQRRGSVPMNPSPKMVEPKPRSVT